MTRVSILSIFMQLHLCKKQIITGYLLQSGVCQRPTLCILINLCNLETDDLWSERELWLIFWGESSEFIHLWNSLLLAVAFNIIHVPLQHLPLLVRVAHGIPTMMKRSKGLKPSYVAAGEQRLMGVSSFSRTTLMFKYTATLKHWSDHVLAKAACKKFI